MDIQVSQMFWRKDTLFAAHILHRSERSGVNHGCRVRGNRHLQSQDIFRDRQGNHKFSKVQPFGSETLQPRSHLKHVLWDWQRDHRDIEVAFLPSSIIRFRSSDKRSNSYFRVPGSHFKMFPHHVSVPEGPTSVATATPSSLPKPIPGWSSHIYIHKYTHSLGGFGWREVETKSTKTMFSMSLMDFVPLEHVYF